MSVRLSHSHLCLDHDLVKAIFKQHGAALLTYQRDKGQLLIAPSTNNWFTKVHEAEQYLLKVKNSKGDRSIAIHSLLLDFEIDDSDRSLPYEVNQKAGWIRVALTTN